MVENKVVITTEVKTGNAVNSLKELKRELKEAQAAALNGDGKAAKRVAELKDRMDDLTDATKTFQGSGVERATSSLNLLGDGFRNLDLDKVKTGFKGLGAAMSAVPIFLLVEGIIYLIQNFEELSQGNGLLAKSLRFVGDIIDGIVDSVYALTDAIGLTNSALDEQGEAIKESAETTKTAMDSQVAAYDRQIKLAQAAGKSTVEIEKAKQKAFIETNLVFVKQIEAFVRAGGELDEEKKRILTASLEAIKTAANEQKVIDIKQQQDTIKASEEAYKRKQELKQKELEDSKKLADDLFAQLSQQQDIEDSQAKFRAEEKRKALEEEIKQAEYAEKVKYEYAKQAALENEKINAEVNERIKASNQAVDDAKVRGLEAGKALSEAFFAFQLNRANGNAAREMEIRKRMFQVDKAFNVARATQDGIRSVQAALTIPPPGGQILAGVNAALAAGNIAKILATKFDGGNIQGGADNLNATVPTSQTNIPTVQNTSAPNINPQTTTFDEQGRVNNRVYVVESDITKTQERVARIDERSTI